MSRAAAPAATVLAFQGGGFLGFFSARVAAHLEDFRSGSGINSPFQDCIDVFAGTSVGSILAVGLAATNTSPTEIARIMADHGEHIFPRRLILPRAPGIFAARFSAGPLRDVLQGILGDKRLGDVDRPLLVPAICETDGRPEIFRSHDPQQAEIKLVDVVLASAAAPLYLPRHKIGNRYYADGGLVANGPALLAALDLNDRFDLPFHRQTIISIGTTYSTPRQAPGHARASWGALDWIFPRKRLIDLLLGGQVEFQGEMLRGLRPQTLLSLDFHLDEQDAKKVDLVAADSAARETLRKAAEAAVDAIAPSDQQKLVRLLQRKARRFRYEQPPGASTLRPRLCDVRPT
jgi:uncharacterized protein